MPKHSAPFNDPDASLSPPDIIGVLNPVSGGEDNLLPKDAWLLPLRVEFELWTDSAPISGTTDVVELIWDGDVDNPVDEKRFEGPIDPSLLWLQVPISKLDEGVHSLYYRLIPWNDPAAERTSVPVNVTIDKTAPILASSSELIFPPEVSPPPKEITAAYLADPANNDQVLATLPDYTEPKVGDVITWYWEQSPGGRDVAGTRTLELGDLGKPLLLPFSGDLLRRSGNGERYATYRVRDRAGNGENVLSSPEKLSVNIRPPTPRKYPTVKQATNFNDTGVLNPFQGGAGVTVVVEASEIDSGEEVTVDFVGLGGEDGVGSVTGVKPITSGGLEFAIPASVVAANIPVNGDGRKVEVHYWAGHDTQHSEVYTLTISPFAAGALGQLVCPLAQVGSPATLSKRDVEQYGADLEIAKWIYQDPAQLMKVWAMASGTQTDFLNGEPLGIDGKFTTVLPKDYVAQRPLNSTFTLYASVSFDQGHSYIAFRTLPLKVIV